MPFRLIRLSLPSGLLACGVLLSAQHAPPPPIFRSSVDAIEIEMRAVDERGRPVVDLDQSEVDVFEDGRKEKLIGFRRVSIPGVTQGVASSSAKAAAPLDVASNRSVASARIFVLLLDDLHVGSYNTNLAKQAARRFVERHVGPADLMSVVYASGRADAAQDFTSQRALLLASIDKFIGRKLRPASVERMEQYNQLFRSRGRPNFEDLRDKQDVERAFNARAAMATIETVSAVLERVTGRRKAMLVFSEGLDYDLSGLRSRGRLATAQQAGPNVAPANAPTGGGEGEAAARPDVHNYANDVIFSLQSAIGAASRANVALYTIDVRAGDVADTLADLGAPVDDPSLGLTTQNAVHEMRDAQESLWMLAENTGGFAALTGATDDAVYARIVRESSEYYLLAYSPWNIVRDGTYRDITVKVKRPGVRVLARKGYYAPRNLTKPRTRFVAAGVSDETAALVMSPLPSTGLSLDVHAAALRGDKKRADVVITAQLHGAEIAPETAAPGVNNTVEVALMAIDNAGRVQAATGVAREIRLEGDAGRQLRAIGYRAVSRVQLAPGRYQIRVAVRERNGGRHGSVFADLDVPAYSDRLALSGVLLASAESDLVPTSIDPDTLKRLPLMRMPAVRRTFASGDHLSAVLELYGGSGGRDIAVTTTVVNSAGKEVVRTVKEVGKDELKREGGRYLHAVDIPLTQLSGDVLMTIEARPRLTGAPVSRQVAFTVSPAPAPALSSNLPR